MRSAEDLMGEIAERAATEKAALAQVAERVSGEYADLVRRAAGGTLNGRDTAAAVAKLLSDAGKSAEDFTADVGVRRQSDALAVTAAGRERMEARLEELVNRRAAVAVAFTAALDGFLRDAAAIDAEESGLDAGFREAAAAAEQMAKLLPAEHGPAARQARVVERVRLEDGRNRDAIFRGLLAGLGAHLTGNAGSDLVGAARRADAQKYWADYVSGRDADLAGRLERAKASAPPLCAPPPSPEIALHENWSPFGVRTVPTFDPLPGGAMRAAVSVG